MPHSPTICGVGPVRMATLCALGASGVILMFGCASVESTMVTRDESNTAWEKHNCLQGMPVTLKVPTHIRINVHHNHYFAVNKSDDGKKVLSVQVIPIGVTVRDYSHEILKTEKIFFVDFKRPPAGKSDLKSTMAEPDYQYFKSIERTTTEETITKVSGLLTSIRGKGPFSAASAKVVGGAGNVVQKIESTVAVGIFEIDAPDFEEKVRAFIDCHVNKAHDAWVVHPDVKSVHRSGIPVGENAQIPYPDQPLCTGVGDCLTGGEHPAPPRAVFADDEPQEGPVYEADDSTQH